MLPKPEEVSKKPKITGENVAKTWGGFKKKKVLEVFKARASQVLVVLRPPQVLARFSVKILLKPEEVSKNQRLKVKMLLKPEEVSTKPKNQSLGGLQSQGLSIFGFFETSSGFGRVLNKKYC